MYAIKDELKAFAFDRAIATFGNALQAEIEGVEGKNKTEIERRTNSILRKWIPEVSGRADQFKDPAMRMK